MGVGMQCLWSARPEGGSEKYLSTKEGVPAPELCCEWCVLQILGNSCFMYRF